MPLTAGPAAAAALSSWSAGPRIAAEVLLWSGWGVGALAVLAPRPPLLTALRLIAPTFALCAVLAAFDGSASAPALAGAVAATLLCAFLTSGPDVAAVAANAAAYGDEQRFPLRVPPALFLGPLPGARLVVAAAVVAPVLLLADGDLVAGLVVLALAVPVGYLLARSLHALSRRWAVLVPAGFVVVDELTLSDPVLFLREHLRAIEPATRAAPAEGVLDLRLGASRGSLVLRFDEPADIVTASRARRGGATVRTEAVEVAVVRSDELLSDGARRRLPVRVPTPARGRQAATPPPTTTSPS